MQQAYVEALCCELATRRNYTNEDIATIYLGGGTPSTLHPSQLQNIFNTIYKHFTIADNPEITIEANPDDLSPNYLATLRYMPFNRISMGVQSFDDTQLKRLGRRHTAAKAKEAVANARNAGFENISIDLMFALPGSTIDQWNNDLAEAIALKPEHISAYNLTYEENTPLYNDMLCGKLKQIDEDDNIIQFEALVDRLTSAGYRHYEISNFSRPGYESRHNSSYWHDIPYLGCGASAHSYNGEERRWNVSNIKKYIESINEGRLCFEAEHLTAAERYNDAILTRLRTADGLPIALIQKNFGNKLTEYMLQEATIHIATGNLERTPDDFLRLTKKGVFVSDAVIRDMIFVD